MGFWGKLLGKEQNVPEPTVKNDVEEHYQRKQKDEAPPDQDSVSKGRETWKKNIENEHPEIADELIKQRGSTAPYELTLADDSEKSKNFLEARLHYMKAVESITQFSTLLDNSYSEEVEKYKNAYFDFVTQRDPLYKNYLEQLLPIIRSNQGILQTELYTRVSIEKSDISYCLYFAAEAGVIKREKKGRTYLLSI